MDAAAIEALEACSARSVAVNPLREPPYVPNAVRFAPTMKISEMESVQY